MMMWKIILLLLCIKNLIADNEDLSRGLSDFFTLPNLTFVFVSGRNGWSSSGYYEPILLNETSSLLNDAAYDNSRPTVLIVHGFTEDYRVSGSSASVLIDAYTNRGDHNILVVDWADYADGNYFTEAIPNAFKVGVTIGDRLVKMKVEGFDIENFHIVGHSLGSHVAGYIGRTVKLNSRLKIRRITALDPAGPGFTTLTVSPKWPVNKFDADFVDIIHTGASTFGTAISTGSVDFWPNGGKTQPGCPTVVNFDITLKENFCSHQRSYYLYAESVRSSTKIFDSVHCMFWDQFTKNNCKDSKNAFMGIVADPSLRGNYFLQTNAESPFDRGLNEITYSYV